MQGRVQQALNLSGQILALQGDDREAARLLFSLLSDVEGIAVLAAERGDCISGQLEDERFHQELFRLIAEGLGGKAPVVKSVQVFIDWMSTLHGPTATLVLNLVCEKYIDVLFKAMSEIGLADEMFALVEADEARHVREAEALPKPKPGDAEPFLKLASNHLYLISADPYFAFPLIHFLGVDRMVAVGREFEEGHRKTCELLGVDPGAFVREIHGCAIEAGGDIEPKLIEQNAWERSAFNLGVGPITTFVKVPVEFPVGELEARTIKAVAEVLNENPRLNRTVNGFRKELYAPQDAVVAVRRLYDREEGKVITLHVKNPQGSPVEAIQRSLASKLRNRRMLPFPEAPDLAPLARLMPRPRAAVAITNVCGMGNEWGLPPLNPYEGCSFSIGITDIVREFYEDGTWKPTVTLGIVADHRAHNGREAGLFCREVKRRLMEVKNG